ncbi:hypothetical protein [Xylanibacter muris]|uniref:Porin n=1 Tax=Xylanibacter muris TaxID=2736290 RepID=A0ABX2AN45_9BACT|nr:hypothetical protein [Xylanibacter muris]NPD92656.1 hypothetical protein [Xylanibacter muris]
MIILLTFVAADAHVSDVNQEDKGGKVPLGIDLSLEGGYGNLNFVNAALCLDYDLGKGWSVCAEAEINYTKGGHATVFEHSGGERSAVAPGSGTEVSVDQLWIQKAFSDAANIRFGRVVVPVGLSNACNATLDYFSVYGREGENAVMPGVWYGMGVSFWGRTGDFGYEAQVVSGLDALMFSSEGWIGGGTETSAFRADRKFGCVARIENLSLEGLRLGVSGYAGHTRHVLDGGERLGTDVFIGAFDFTYERYGLLVRGQADYGYMSGTGNLNRIKTGMEEDCGVDVSAVAKNVFAFSVEAGYDMFSVINSMKDRGCKFFVFGRYDNYDSFASGTLFSENVETGISGMFSGNRHELLSFGINYHPTNTLALKAEMTKRLKNTHYADESFVCVGFAYEGSLF